MSPSAHLVALPPLEMWGGLECTVARIGDRYVDQTLLNGHQDRAGDLDAFAGLGIRAIRYPVLWERIAPDGLDRADWRWTDERLGRLRELGVAPIAGLLHHGSGPPDTDLGRPDFPARVAAFAARVAERYPWLELYTPVNEPLTTARFSGLYGHWYPHARDHGAFLRMLVNQCEAVRLSMRAIRAVNPAARLVQTEDLGRAIGTPRLAYQVEHENHRRWLSLDLLAGRVDRDHPLRSYLVRWGVSEAELEGFEAEPCPPDIVGINHYLSSERFLDDRLERYPGVRPTDNGKDHYVDVEALRAADPTGVSGLENLLREAWDRYGLPVAVTEVHNGSTREEQLRWLAEAWASARRLREDEGVDVRAVTAWALLGSYDWDSLLTRQSGHYEPGLFDVRGGGRPRPTALARMVREITRTGTAAHPTLDAPGWWHREERYLWGPPSPCCPTSLPRRARQPFGPVGPAAPLLIAGGGGALARTLAELCAARGLPYLLTSRREFDVADPASVMAGLAVYRPWAVVNAAGYARVDRAESEPERCRRETVEAARVLGGSCAAAGTPLLAFSTHLVFDGEKAGPYLEDDPAAPLGVYGRCKAEAERVLLTTFPDALIVRSGPLFGPRDDRSVAARAIRAVAAGERFAAADDVTVSPAYRPDLVHAALDLLLDRESGLWHLANAGAVSHAEFARAAVRAAGLDAGGVLAVPATGLGWAARRPRSSVLGSSRGALLRPLDHALARYADARRPAAGWVPPAMPAPEVALAAVA